MRMDTFLQHLIPAVLLIAVALVGPGCAAIPKPSRQVEQPSRPLSPDLDAASSLRLRLTVESVTGEDGGSLWRSQTGWIALAVLNTGQERIGLTTAATFGKGHDRQVIGEPAYTRWPYFNGMGLSMLKYEFLDQAGLCAHQGQLDPPDSHMMLAHHEHRTIWRRLTAPARPGVYQLRVLWDTRPANDAMETHNDVDLANMPPEQSAVMSTVAEGVVIK